MHEYGKRIVINPNATRVPRVYTDADAEVWADGHVFSSEEDETDD